MFLKEHPGQNSWSHHCYMHTIIGSYILVMIITQCVHAYKNTISQL